jgi:hypothetical protein
MTVARVPVVTPSGLIFQSAYSQYWMDPAYDTSKYGTPTLAQKAAFSSADFSRDFAGTISEMYVNAYGTAVSPAIKEMAEMYPHLGIDTTKEPVTQTVAEQSVQPAVAADELAAKLEGMIGAGIGWITNNLLLIVIAGAAVFVLPSLLSAALPTKRRR